MLIVHTQTKKDFIKIVKWALDNGKVWCDGSKYIHKDCWDIYCSQTCVIIKKNALMYCSKSFAIRKYGEIKPIGIDQFLIQPKDYYHNKFKEKYNLK